jgi:hypothetical protein
MVRAAQLEPRALLESLERGDFYASTGVVLDTVETTPKSLSIRVKSEGTAKYRIQFIGQGGRMLTEVPDVSATYTFTADDAYVRARVLDSNGHTAWVQPVMMPR